MFSCGCLSTERATSDVTGEEHVLISNFGYYLFGCVPLCCGNANLENKMGNVAFFRNDVTMDKVQAIIMNLSKEQNRPIHELNYHNTHSIFLSVPLFAVVIPIPYLITTKEIQLSGVMK